jgi:hypothetical protein
MVEKRASYSSSVRYPTFLFHLYMICSYFAWLLLCEKTDLSFIKKNPVFFANWCSRYHHLYHVDSYIVSDIIRGQIIWDWLYGSQSHSSGYSYMVSCLILHVASSQYMIIENFKKLGTKLNDRINYQCRPFKSVSHSKLCVYKAVATTWSQFVASLFCNSCYLGRTEILFYMQCFWMIF